MRRQREASEYSPVLVDYYPDDDAISFGDDDEITPFVPLDIPKGNLPTSDQMSFDSFPNPGTLRCAVRLVRRRDHGQLIFGSSTVAIPDHLPAHAAFLSMLEGAVQALG